MKLVMTMALVVALLVLAGCPTKNVGDQPAPAPSAGS